MKSRHLFHYLCALLLLLAACDHIDEDERYIYVKPAAVQRTVLIEDFTGQGCVNCPKATEVITQLEEQYPDGVIAVAIHCGPFARSATGTRYPLGTDEGDAYYQHWNFDRQPIGMVNRQGLSDYTDWTTLVHKMVQLTAPLSIAVQADADPDIRQLNVVATIMAIDGNVGANLQLWLVEDGIVNAQYMPDGSVNRAYVHNHVLRRAINGTWGEQVTLGEGQTATIDHSIALEEGWNMEHLRVVAFVYDNTGVLQAAQTNVNIPENE